jgi:hypothetical protein
VVIEEVATDNWGVAGMSVTKYRAQERAAINKAEYPNLLALVGQQTRRSYGRDTRTLEGAFASDSGTTTRLDRAPAIREPWSVQTL